MDKKKLKLVSSISVVLVRGFLVTSFSSYFVSRASLRSEISLNELPLTSDNIYSDYDGKYIGATGVGLTVNAVKELIETYQEKYNRTVYFVDRIGDIKITGSGFDSRITNISQFAEHSLFRDMLGTKVESSFSYRKDGQVVHTNIRYIDEFKWHLVVEQSEQEVIAHIFTTLLINLIICIVIIVIVLFLVHFSVTAYQERIETLRGIVPICSYCKQIRDDKGYWNRVESYVAKYTEAQFSHSICPSCMNEHYPEEYESIEQEKNDISGPGA